MKRFINVSIILIGLMAAAPLVHAAKYSITDLGVGGVVDINNSGQILGNSSNGAFIWNNGSVTNLGSFTATDINNSGQVVGNQGINLYKWDNGSLTNVSSPDFFSYWYFSGGSKINDSGTIYSQFEGGPYVGVLQNGSANWALTTGGDNRLLGINNNNQYVGYNIGGGDPDPIIYTNGSTIYPFGVPGAPYTFVIGQLNSINDKGQAVGGVRLPGSYNTENAVLWDNGVVTNFGNGSALDINDLGQIVGVNGGRATIWENGASLDLNNLISDNAWTLTSALEINDLGQIIGTGLFNGETHSFLLTDPPPVPEPSTFLLLGSGLAVVGFLRKRKSRR